MPSLPSKKATTSPTSASPPPKRHSRLAFRVRRGRSSDRCFLFVERVSRRHPLSPFIGVQHRCGHLDSALASLELPGARLPTRPPPSCHPDRRAAVFAARTGNNHKTFPRPFPLASQLCDKHSAESQEGPCANGASSSPSFTHCSFWA